MTFATFVCTQDPEFTCHTSCWFRCGVHARGHERVACSRAAGYMATIASRQQTSQQHGRSPADHFDHERLKGFNDMRGTSEKSTSELQYLEAALC